MVQGSGYKPRKEPMNYRGSGGDWTHDLQTEATPPAASCPARSLHATEIVSENTSPMTYTRRHWTTDRCQSQHLCVLILNCDLSLDIFAMAAASSALHAWQYEWSISICLKSGNMKPLVAKWPCCFKDIFIYIYIYAHTYAHTCIYAHTYAHKCIHMHFFRGYALSQGNAYIVPQLTDSLLIGCGIRTRDHMLRPAAGWLTTLRTQPLGMPHK